MLLKVYLDDERPSPKGWSLVSNPYEAITLLKTNQVIEISLDHDLGDDVNGTGYDVLKWIEEQVATKGFKPPKIYVHSANASAVVKMKLGIQSILRLQKKNESSPG